MKLCCIDVGTNSVLSLLSRIDSIGRVTPLEFHAETTRLGRNLRKKGIFDEKACKRTISTVKKYMRGADKYLIVGTSALREAKDTENFGLPIKILSEEEEAHLVFDSVRHFLNPLPKKTLICDIGGGSTEFIFSVNGMAIRKISIPIGAVNLTERFRNRIIDMESFIRSKIKGQESSSSLDFARDSSLPSMGLRPSCGRYAPCHPLSGAKLRPLTTPIAVKESILYFPLQQDGFRLIGVGGTVTTLGAILKRLKHYDPNKVHGYIVPFAKVTNILKRLHSLSLNERKKIISFDPKRADIIVAGLCILKVIMETFGADKIRICDRGLVYGLALNHSKYTRGTFNLHKTS